MSKRNERILARRAAVQVLYQSEICGISPEELLSGDLVPEEAKVNDYAREIVLGVAEHRSEIDRAIGESSQNWAIDRMPIVDRSVLRLAIYEMRYVDDVPRSVAINEAVELAKEFGGEDESHRFVNGILGRLARLDAPSGEGDALAAGGSSPDVAEQQVASGNSVEIPTMGILADFNPDSAASSSEE